MDDSKAFDNVSYEKLFLKLENYGFRGPFYDLFKSYLSNRQQVVQIDGHKSCREIVTYGVPQATVLGPY